MKTKQIEVKGISELLGLEKIKNITLSDGSLWVVYEIEEPEFKAGDILVANNNVLCVFKRYESDTAFESYCTTLCTTLSNNQGWGVRYFVHATPDQIIEFHKIMAEKGLKWNPEKMELEPIRWRAKNSEKYAIVHYDDSTGMNKVIGATENYPQVDDLRYNSGNYFNPNDPTDMAEAQSICDKINELFAARC